MSESLSVEQIVEILLAVTRDLEAAKDRLTELDAAIGDGDLGITFSRGAAGIRAGLKDYPPDVGQIVMKAGMDFTSTAGSTMGAILGTALVQAGKAAKGQSIVDLPTLARMAKAAVHGVQECGKARPGDKTVLDAMAPASQALAQAAEQHTSLMEGMQQAAEAAEQGAEATTKMRAIYGRARWLGERSIGHPDPGAVAICIILQSAVKSIQRFGVSGSVVPPAA